MAPSLDLHTSTRLNGTVVLEPPFKVFANVNLNGFVGGAFSYVSPGTALHRVRLGRYCSVGDQVAILSAHPTDSLTTSPFVYQTLFPAPFNAPPQREFHNMADTAIGHDVWLGSGVRLKSGISIGDGAIVGAGSVVTHDVPPFAVVGGVPARIIRHRFDEATRQRVQALAWGRFNLVGMQLPWGDVPALLSELEQHLSQGQLPAYAPNSIRVWREGNEIKGRPLAASV